MGRGSGPEGLGIIPARAGFTGLRPVLAALAGDHPRSRGVYRSSARARCARRGSSPLARGLLDDTGDSTVAGGIIPARAGFTRVGHRPGPEGGDHPRSRGVYPVGGGDPPFAVGSSPLARGLPAAGSGQWPGSGIIPARAGFTRRLPHGRRHGADHPRSRGVYNVLPLPPRTRGGSSPLARGLLTGTKRLVMFVRIIPARAGFTTTILGRGRPHQDHPRSRGVYAPPNRPSSSGTGSSPLARGLQRFTDTAVAHVRIIPARAGFTWWRPGRARRAGDHPRSRGVYAVAQSSGIWPRGSSPLARGLLVGVAAWAAAWGIIPARAGFTGRVSAAARLPGDHPRSRGVYTTTSARSISCTGSSPLARGLRHRRHHPLDLVGIIPARAGFTAGGAGAPDGPGDHPRSRGVYTSTSRTPRRRRGSSPLARGLRGARPRRARARGIIPARAGFTYKRFVRAQCFPDHPRSRGVYAHPPRSSIADPDHPRSRGVYGPFEERENNVRIIPARAGFTRRPTHMSGRAQDHPRSRGVYMSSVASAGSA